MGAGHEAGGGTGGWGLGVALVESQALLWTVCVQPRFTFTEILGQEHSLVLWNTVVRCCRCSGTKSSLFAESHSFAVRLLSDPDCSTPGLPFLYRLPKLAQTHVHPVDDAIQPSHPLSSPLLPPLVFPSIRVFSSVSSSIRWPKYWSFSFNISPFHEYSGLISFRID